MPRQGKPRAAADTVRLKRQIAQNDSSIRAHARVLAAGSGSPAMKSAMIGKARDLVKEANAKQDTLNAIRKAKPTGTHKSFARDTEGFDGRAVTGDAGRPPRVSIPRGNPSPDVLPSATGRPALARATDGTENIGAATQTFAAGDSRPTASSGRGTRAAVSRFNDAGV